MDNKIFILHRKKIDKIDHELIKLVEKRLDSAKEIGKYKKKHGMKIINRKREREVLDDRIKNSKLPKRFTRKLFKLLIRESRRVQR